MKLDEQRPIQSQTRPDRPIRVARTEAVAQVRSGRESGNEYAEQAYRRAAGSAEQPSSNAGEGHAEPQDLTALHGLDDRHLSPEARRVILDLLGEVAELRESLAHARRRVAHLEQLADRDPKSPVFNRQAFLRELANVIRLDGDYGARSSLLAMKLAGVSAVKERYGQAAADSMVSAVGQALADSLGDSAIIGRIEEATFAVALVGGGASDNAMQPQALAEAVAARGATWAGEALDIGLQWGIQQLNPEDEAEQAVDRLVERVR